MEQVRNEQTIYSAAAHFRLSKDDEQAGESVSIETQKMMLRCILVKLKTTNNSPRVYCAQARPCAENKMAT